MKPSMEKNIRRRRKKSDRKNTHKASTSSGEVSNSCSSIGAFVIVLLTLSLFVAYLFSPISAVYIDGIVEVAFDGMFSINEKLSEGKKISMFAPESIVEDDSRNLYVGLRDGRITKIYPSKSGFIGEGETEVLFDGKIDTVSTTDLSHGIPLGLRLRGNTLFVMDAIYGFYTLDLTSRKIKFLIKPNDVSPPMKFPNDFDINSNGTVIYFTDSSSIHSINMLLEEAMEGTCTGRLFSYDVNSGRILLLTSDLCFANGVQLTKDERTVIVSETTRYRVSWIDVETGEKKTVLHLPAMPDNVRSNRHGSYWIAGSAKLSRPLTFLLRYPILRQLLLGLLPESLLMKVPNRKHNMLFEVDDNGEMRGTLHDPSGRLTYALSQGMELSDGRIALGSYAAPYLAIASSPFDPTVV